jgi:hypothetical protein
MKGTKDERSTLTYLEFNGSQMPYTASVLCYVSVRLTMSSSWSSIIFYNFIIVVMQQNVKTTCSNHFMIIPSNRFEVKYGKVFGSDENS